MLKAECIFGFWWGKSRECTLQCTFKHRWTSVALTQVYFIVHECITHHIYFLFILSVGLVFIPDDIVQRMRLLRWTCQQLISRLRRETTLKHLENKAPGKTERPKLMFDLGGNNATLCHIGNSRMESQSQCLFSVVNKPSSGGQPSFHFSSLLLGFHCRLCNCAGFVPLADLLLAEDGLSWLLWSTCTFCLFVDLVFAQSWMFELCRPVITAIFCLFFFIFFSKPSYIGWTIFALFKIFQLLMHAVEWLHDLSFHIAEIIPFSFPFPIPSESRGFMWLPLLLQMSVPCLYCQ